MTTTYHLPGGRKIRIASQRRFVLVRLDRNDKPYVVRRSDAFETIRKLRYSSDFVVDQRGIGKVAYCDFNRQPAWQWVNARPDRLGNTIAQEGCDRCGCGCKYWENDRCVDCNTHVTSSDVERCN
jgi:hypothetical protein